MVEDNPYYVRRGADGLRAVGTSLNSLYFNLNIRLELNKPYTITRNLI